MRTLVTAVALLLAAVPLAAQTPRDELLRLVPADTAICLVVQGVRERSQTIAASPLAAWVRDKYRPALGAAPELEKLKDVEKLFTTFLGVSLTDLRDDIFGDAIVLTYTPGPVGRPDAEQGCVMLQARDPDKLTALVGKLNALQQTTKELTAVTQQAHAGQKYFQRVKADGRHEFYLLDNGLFVFAAQEGSIRALIDQRQNLKADPSPVAKAMGQLGVQDAFLTCWFNPRKLDAEVAAHVAAAGSAKEKAARRQFAQIWSAFDSLALYVAADKDLELGFAAAYRADALPAEWKVLLGSRARASALWQVIPDDALFAVAGRATGSQIVDALLSFTPADDRVAVRAEVEKTFGAVIGRKNVPGLLRGVGPDWGVWVTRGRSWVPSATLALGLADDEAVRAAAAKTVTFYTQNAQAGYNRDHDDQIESHTEKDVTVFANPTLFPAGVRPAYGLTDGYLVAASSPDQVTAFRKPTLTAAVPAEAVVMRVSGAALHAYLNEHAKPIAAWVAAQQDRPLDAVVKEIGTVAEAVSVLDRGEVVLRGDGQVLRCTVRLKFVKPLAK